MTSCRVCSREFQPMRPMASVCSVPCARKLPAINRKSAKAHDKYRREAVKPRKKWLAETQAVFNAVIRARDFGKPCICCGAAMNWNSDKPGGEIDAGHFLSIGSAPHMRFVEGNVHAQRKSCNKPGGAKRHAFRAGMIERIGLSAVEVIEADQTPRKYTVDDLRALKAEYKARLKAMLDASNE